MFFSSHVKIFNLHFLLVQEYEKYVTFIFFIERKENYPETIDKCNPLL